MGGKQIVSAAEAVEITRLKLPTIRLYVQKKLIPHIKVGRRVLFRVNELEDWLSAHAVPVQERPQ